MLYSASPNINRSKTLFVLQSSFSLGSSFRYDRFDRNNAHQSCQLGGARRAGPCLGAPKLLPLLSVCLCLPPPPLYWCKFIASQRLTNGEVRAYKIAGVPAQRSGAGHGSATPGPSAHLAKPGAKRSTICLLYAVWPPIFLVKKCLCPFLPLVP